jgi:hypothetical protein
MELQPALLKSLHGLSSSIDEKVHLLASKGDAGLSELALEVTKHLFDLGMFPLSWLALADHQV